MPQKIAKKRNNRNGALFVIAKVNPDAALLAAARQVSRSILVRPEVTEAERKHRNVVLSHLDDAEGW